MTTIIDSRDIDKFRLATLRGAVRLEKAGMTRRGKSAKSICIKELGMKPGSSHDEVIAKLTARIESQ